MCEKNSSLKSKKICGSLFIILSLTFLISLCCSGNVFAEEEILKGKTVNVNTATVEEFMEVPLITEELAEAIVEYREEAGDFQVIEELLQVDGFDRTLLRKIKGFLLLEGIGGDECTC
jgi:competence ComEA-like helix-hairpin-helix protein